VAHAAAGPGLSDRSTSTPCGCGCARTAASEAAPAIWPWASPATASARCWDLVTGDRRRQVPAGRPQRSPAPRRQGRSDRLRQRPHRLSRRDRRRLFETWVQSCIVHQFRASLRYVNYRDRRQVAKLIYLAIEKSQGKWRSNRAWTAAGPRSRSTSEIDSPAETTTNHNRHPGLTYRRPDLPRRARTVRPRTSPAALGRREGATSLRSWNHPSSRRA